MGTSSANVNKLATPLKISSMPFGSLRNSFPLNEASPRLLP